MNWLLVSDVDGTLLGDPAGLEAFASWVRCRRTRLALCYSSGRNVRSLRASVQETELPEPDLLVGEVGTEVVSYPDLAPDLGWRQALLEGWDPDAVEAVARRLFPGMTQQPEEFQSGTKRSFYLHEASPEALDGLRWTLEEEGLPARVVYSSERDLDLLPAGAGKGEAAAHVARSRGYSPDRVVVAGDSGNDLAMFQQGFRGVVVGNAHRELRELRGGEIFHADAPCAGGVLQGLQYWMERSPR